MDAEGLSLKIGLEAEKHQKNIKSRVGNFCGKNGTLLWCFPG